MEKTATTESLRISLTEKALAYARRLVQIESVTFRERSCAEALAEILRGMSFDVEIDDNTNLVARLRGKDPGAPVLMFMGHHDTVELGDSAEWDYPPLEAVVENGRLHGRGSNDEKGGLAALLAALDLMLARGLRSRGDILVVSTREEVADLDRRGILQLLRRGGAHLHDGTQRCGGTHLRDGALLQADACICLEPTSTRLMLGHRGRAVADFTVRGRAAHASMPARGINAIAKAADLIAAIRQMSLPGASAVPVETPRSGWPPPADWAGTQAVTMISGGTRENIVPEECRFSVDRRTLDGEDEHTLAAEYQAVIDRLQACDPDFLAEFSIRPPYYAALTDRKDGFVREMQEISRVVGIEDEPEIFPGHTDAEWVINDMGIPCVICGPGSLSTAHTAREFVPVEELGICAEVYFRAMVDPEYDSGTRVR